MTARVRAYCSVQELRVDVVCSGRAEVSRCDESTLKQVRLQARYEGPIERARFVCIEAAANGSTLLDSNCVVQSVR